MQGIAEWLMYRRTLSLAHPPTDPRYGIPPGDDEADNYNRLYYHSDVTPPLHFYSSAAEAYRAFTEMGAVWTEIGSASSREDVRAHGAQLLQVAPLLYRDLHASLNRTRAGKSGDCWPHRVEGNGPGTKGQMGAIYRGYPEMFFSGALTYDQVAPLPKSSLHLLSTACLLTRARTDRWMACIGVDLGSRSARSAVGCAREVRLRARIPSRMSRWVSPMVCCSTI